MKDWKDYDRGDDMLVLVGPMLGRKAEKLKPQVAVDGGILHAVAPLLWAGDGDSAGLVPNNVPAFTKHNQDETDLRFCLNGLRSWKWTELHLVGFLGGRRDHELANFGEIHAELKERAGFRRAVFYDNQMAARIFFYPAGSHMTSINGLFSLMALEPTVVSVAGSCEFTAEKQPLPPLSGLGVSNRGAGEIKITASTPLMLLLEDDDKNMKTKGVVPFHSGQSRV
ncbi:MAG: hypothetical protein ACAH80_05165 [Alphaproteobacteria bacterium]